MTEETGAAAPTDAQAATSAPAESEQAKPAQSVATDAAPEAETKPDEGDGTTSPEEATEDKPRKPSRSERMRRRMAAMATELDSLRTQLSSGNQSVKSLDAPPREEDFGGDYFKFQAAQTAYEVKQAMRAELEGERQRIRAEQEHARRRESVEEFEERAEEYKTRIPDFEQTLVKFVESGGKFSPALIEELQDSDMGPALAYQLARNPNKVAELNAMSPRDVAREIGRLEARSSLPNPKRQTSAPPPLKTLNGGASPPVNLLSLAKSDNVEAYWAERNKQK